MFDNLKNLSGMLSMLGNAKELRSRFEQIQAELARKTVEADAGAGAVRVVVNGHLEVLSVRLDRPLLAGLTAQGDEVDQQMVEDLITAAVNAAMAKARDMVQQEMSQLAGGLNLPGLGQLLEQQEE